MPATAGFRIKGRVKLELAFFGGALLAAPFFARLFVVFAGLENFKDAFALDFFLQALEGFFQ